MLARRSPPPSPAQRLPVSIDGKYLHFDGARWQPLPWAGKTVGGELHLAPDGSLCLATGALLGTDGGP